jgi:hypothetical protein
MNSVESSKSHAAGDAALKDEKLDSDPKEISWGTWAKAAAAFLGAFVAALNLIGHIAYSTWMDHWGFDAGVIPLDSNARLVLGFVAFTDRLVSLWDGGSGWLGVTLFVALGLYSSILFVVKAAARRSGGRQVELAWVVEGTPWWLRQIALGWGLSGGVVVWLYATLISASVILVVAPTIGKSYGDVWARRIEARIQKGCQPAGARSTCTEVVRDGQPIGVGLILTSSSTHVAFYDHATKRTRLVRLEGADMTGWMP